MSAFRLAVQVPFGFQVRLHWAAGLALIYALWPRIPALGGEGGELTQARYSYHYFKEKRKLTLDVGRVAIQRMPGEDGSVAAVPSLSRFGLDDSTVEPMAIRGWSSVKTTAAIRTEAAIEGAVREIAGGKLADFVSPVFVDDQGGPIVITPHILVGFDRALDPSRAEAILAESKAGEIVDRDWAHMKRVYRLKSASRDGFEVLRATNGLAQRPEVIFAEPDMIVTGHAESIPDDTYYPYLWALHNDGTFPAVSCTLDDFDMDAPEAWGTTTGAPSIIVAVLDTGVQQDHPDLNLYIPGFDATGEGGGGGPVNACDNHGTLVAGCISGIIDNNLGIVGIAPGVKSAAARMIVSDLACDGFGLIASSWVVDALAWAESIGARITNSSWHRNSPSSAIDQKYADTRAAGMVHFAAAGNSASDTIKYPASLPSVNAVAALDPCGNRAVFSNYGVGLAFSAPGHYGISTDRTGSDGSNDGIGDGACVPDGELGCSSDFDCTEGRTCLLVSEDYALVAGTSIASPYAAGVAALVLSINPTLTASQVEQILKESAVDLGPAGYDTEYGWGLINAANAVQAVPPTPPVPAVSHWGIAIMFLGLLVLATIRLSVRRKAAIGPGYYEGQLGIAQDSCTEARR